MTKIEEKAYKEMCFTTHMYLLISVQETKTETQQEYQMQYEHTKMTTEVSHLSHL